MRKLLVMPAFAGAVVLSSASARAAGTMIPPTALPAPVGHARPTERSVTPDSPADAIEQRQLSAFDAHQRKLDEMLDTRS
jgi:hypothetical protein